MPAPTHRLRLIVGLALLMACAWIAYLPGLSGGFLFDDYVNLNAIGATGPGRRLADLLALHHFRKRRSHRSPTRDAELPDRCARLAGRPLRLSCAPT